MPDGLATAFASAFAIEGLWWVVIGAFLAGVVRGFSGFGTALIFLPFAASVLSPLWALIALVVMDIVGPLPNLRRAMRDGSIRDVGLLWGGMVVALPIGLWCLSLMEPTIFRYAVSVMAVIVPVLLIGFFRYRGPLTPPVMVVTGAFSGFLGGAAGLPGPPVILLFLGSRIRSTLTRANSMMYLFVFDVTLLVVLGVQGKLEWPPIMVGVVLIVPTLAGNILGAAIFRPEYDGVYRVVAYILVMVSAVMGLPIWDQ